MSAPSFLTYLDSPTLTEMAGGRSPDSVEDLDAIVAEFDKEMTEDAFGFAPGNFGQAFLTELCLLICGGEGSEHYQQFRSSAGQWAEKGQGAIVGGLAGIVGAQLGVEAAIVTPYLARSLALCLVVGHRTMCRRLSAPLP